MLREDYKVFDDFYVTGGGGVEYLRNDTLYSSFTEKGIYHEMVYPPKSGYLPSVFIGIGYSGSVGFIELRHAIGLSHFQLSNGDIGHFEITEVNFGLNLHF